MGAVLWATTHIEQEALSVLFGWLWLDSATAVHNIRDRQSHVDHREVNRIDSCIGLDSISIIRVVSPKATPGKLLWERIVSDYIVAPPSRRLSLRQAQGRLGASRPRSRRARGAPQISTK